MPIKWNALALDNLSNFTKKMGSTTDDPAYNTNFNSRLLSYSELDNMYCNSSLTAKIVDIPIDDAMQKGRYITDPEMDEETKDRIYECEDTLSLNAKFSNAAKWARLYGGALLMVGIRGEKLDDPLIVETIKPGTLDFLLALDASEVTSTEINTTDITKANYRQPTFYNVNGTNVHYSRVILFDGVDVPYRIRANNNGFGLSIIQKIYDDIFRAEHAAQSADAMLWNASNDVIKVPGLFEKVSSNEESSALYARFTLANIMRSNLSLMILDNDETFERHAVQFGGVVDLIRQNLEKVSSAADIPATRLLGKSPDGMNATGSSDAANYLDMISAIQENNFRPKFTALDQIVMKHLGIESETYSFAFNPLWEMTALQVADIENKNAQRDQIYLSSGIITPEIVVSQLKEEETYTAIDDNYIKALEDITREAPAPTPTDAPAPTPAPTPARGDNADR